MPKEPVRDYNKYRFIEHWLQAHQVALVKFFAPISSSPWSELMPQILIEAYQAGAHRLVESWPVELVEVMQLNLNLIYPPKVNSKARGVMTKAVSGVLERMGVVSFFQQYKYDDAFMKELARVQESIGFALAPSVSRDPTMAIEYTISVFGLQECLSRHPMQALKMLAKEICEVSMNQTNRSKIVIGTKYPRNISIPAILSPAFAAPPSVQLTKSAHLQANRTSKRKETTNPVLTPSTNSQGIESDNTVGKTTKRRRSNTSISTTNASANKRSRTNRK